jgi:fucose permease
MLILVICLLIFVGYGIPASYLGAAWPAICDVLPFNISYAGYLSTIMAIGVVLASLITDRMLRKMGTAKFVMLGSVILAGGVFLVSGSSSFVLISIAVFIEGFGSGCTDTALNNYVAIHFSSRSMNWLHFAWGMGSTVGTLIMGQCIATGNNGWRLGYRIAAGVMALVIIIVLITLRRWAKTPTEAVGGAKDDDQTVEKALSYGEIFAIKGAPYAFLAMLCYCAIEQSSALWASTYLAQVRGINAASAAAWAGFFWSGCTFGRLGCGFIANQVGDKNLIRGGVIAILIGAALIVIPFGATGPALAGMLIAGVGCAPIYPCIMHILPSEFGENRTQSILPLCSASANAGTVIIPMVLGIVADFTGMGIFPFALLIFGGLLVLVTEKMHSTIKKAKAAGEL